MDAESQFASAAERHAKEAEVLPAFNGLNLLHIRRQVTQFLGLIGRDGIFDQYTVHDITHIDKMLNSLDWILPDTTKQTMSPADWLMTVLSIYFHDMGMLVTAREYDARSKSDFPRYRDETLFGGQNGEDYKAKVKSLGLDRAERFLYQEFVRHRHAERIRAWVSGQSRTDLGSAGDAFDQVNTLLTPLGPQFRRDLGLVCESHHLNDLHDLKKYKVSQPYGDSDAETANLQYSAVLLRTTDLLHITSDRTPSVSFKVINPTDPLSQQEWAKQMAVRRVRPKLGVNADGLPDETVPKDTIEVHAYFTDDNGFFGLTSYLAYAGDQLRKSHEWITNTQRLNLAKHEFPWRRIDDTHIETEGFIRDSFEFTIDQGKILDLLTGHTLYNDTRVVLRELVQNAIDAIRLHFFPASPRTRGGRVVIRWNSAQRRLSVTDNGTGMTQKIISNFLLRVGSSRYQDPEFKKQYPEFSSISRFGIGVLSTFMIADSVEITTAHEEEEYARRLTLRSVHGKYLIRLLPKTDPEARTAVPHGTEMSLKLRPSVRMDDLLATAKYWVVVPECDVLLQIDSDDPVRIGYETPADALLAQLSELNISAELGLDTKPAPERQGVQPVRVLQKTSKGVTVAYAIQWSEFFREWSFVTRPARETEEERIVLGTCIEGIRVESSTPGFDGTTILAIANVVGPDAPKTNVARSGLESTPERDAMLREVYGIFRDHVATELYELQSSRSFSLTWAIEEARYLLQDVYSSGPRERRPTSPTLLKNALDDLEMFAIERGRARHAISPRALAAESGFWTIDSGLLRSAEPLIKEAASSASLSRILETLAIDNLNFPTDLVLCGVRPKDKFGPFAFSNREIDKIVIHSDQRRADFHWSHAGASRRWMSIPRHVEAFEIRLVREGTHRGGVHGANELAVGRTGLEVEAPGGDIAIRAFGQLMVLPGTPLAAYMLDQFNRATKDRSPEMSAALLVTCLVIDQCSRYSGQLARAEPLVRRYLRWVEEAAGLTRHVEVLLRVPDLVDLISTTTWKIFDSLAWRRGSPGRGFDADEGEYAWSPD